MLSIVNWSLFFLRTEFSMRKEKCIFNYGTLLRPELNGRVFVSLLSDVPGCIINLKLDCGALCNMCGGGSTQRLIVLEFLDS